MGNRDERLDQWVETRLLRRSRSKRYAVPGYTKYTNRALLTLSDIEMPYSLKRREDLKYEISALGHTEISDSWEDLALSVCRLLYRVVEGSSWPHSCETSDAEKDY